MYLLTDDAYKPLGAVAVNNGRWIGHDTQGREMFDRKDFSGAKQASKKVGRLVTTAWYGVRA
jgi:hypothetical protein